MTGANHGEKTEVKHWDTAWQAAPRPRLPSRLWAETGSRMRVLRRHVRAGMRFLEIGCAPGKLAAWVASELGAEVSGVDYSMRGLKHAKELFQHLGLKGDFRCEDLFKTSFANGSFDVVFSNGVIEHFDDPRPIVRKHFELVKPGGKVVILIPNYGGIYGKMQGWFDPENLKLHNLEIMTASRLRSLAPLDLASEIRCGPAGRVSPGIISFEKRWPRPLALGTAALINAIGLVQPMDIGVLSANLLLEATRIKREMDQGAGE
jgi:2-polyprenyl-3-methyl-5-hydroxy-6-metoxy-1,4-benzoquinol methylase